MSSSHPVRYRWRDKTTGNLFKYEDGTSLVVAKNGSMCETPESGTRGKVRWGVKKPNIVLEIATYKLDGQWVYQTLEKPVEKFSVGYRVGKLVNDIKNKLKGKQ